MTTLQKAPECSMTAVLCSSGLSAFCLFLYPGVGTQRKGRALSALRSDEEARVFFPFLFPWWASFKVAGLCALQRGAEDHPPLPPLAFSLLEDGNVPACLLRYSSGV